jgi:hypothetical protein
MCGHVEIVKRFKPEPARDDLSLLIKEASTFAKRDVMAYLLGMGANPNDKPNGGSSALDGCLKSLRWEDTYSYPAPKVIPASNLTKSRGVIRLLLERGALWKPDAHTLADVRKALYRIDPAVITEITESLRDRHACDEAVLQDLLRAPKMQDLLRAHRRSKLEAEGALALQRRRAGLAKAAVAPSPPVPAPVRRYLARYDRDHLYRQVWSAPMPKIAKHYGATTAEIAKACHHLNIPVPAAEYWADASASHRRPAPPLPALL